MPNAAPITYGDAFSLPHDQMMSVPAFSGVLSNDTDADSDPLTAIQVSSPSHGSLTLLSDGGFSYQPDSGYIGSDSFTYKANDGALDSNTATVTFTITNTTPTAWGNLVPLDVSHSGQTDPINLSEYSTDSDFDTLQFTIVAQPTHGQVSLDENDCYVYTPDLDYTGQDSFSFVANDGFADSNSATFSFNVTNTTPTAWSNSTALDVVRNNLSDPIDLSVYSSDAEDDYLVFTVGQPSHGEVYAIGGSTFIYVSDSGYTGEDSFTFQGNDGVADTSEATFTVNVTNVAPTIDDTSTYQVLKNEAITIADLNTYGADASTENLTPEIVTVPAHGDLDDLGGGIYMYTPDANYVGTDSLTYLLSDGVEDSSTATVYINVVDTSVTANDGRKLFSGLAPLVISASELLTNAQSILSSPSFEVTSVSTPATGELVDNEDGTWTYTPPADALAGFEGGFTFTITDGVNTDTANFTLLVPDRHPSSEPISAQDQRLYLMRGVSTLFPTGFTIQNYNVNPAYWNNQLAESIHQGFVGGDSVVASTTIATILNGRGFNYLSSMITEQTQNNVVVGYTVGFVTDRAGAGITINYVQVGVPTDAERRIYGASYNATLGASLWYTVYEMAYVQRFREGPINLYTIGNFDQPRPTSLTAQAALRMIADPINGAQAFNIPNTQQADLIDQLSNPNAYMTAFTPLTFTQQQQATATEFGIDASHCYAIFGYGTPNGVATVTLRNPHNRSGLGGTLIHIPLADFQQLFDTLTAPI